MKKIIASLALALLLSGLAQAQDHLSGKYTVKVDVTNLPDKPGKFFYSYYNMVTRESVVDSIEVKENEIKFRGVLEEPTQMVLRYVSSLDPKSRKIKSGNAFVFYAEPGDMKITVTDSLSNASIKGSATQLEYKRFNDLVKPYNERQNVLYKDYSDLAAKKDSVGMKNKEAEIDALDAEIIEKVYKPYYKENAAKTPVAIRALRMVGANTEEQYNEVENLLKLMPAKYRELPSAKLIAEGIEIGRKTAIGAYAMDFTQNDTLDHAVSLSSFKGKYVLLDFWASWSGPCRRENPNLVKSFNRFKEKGFTVFSVSLDQPGKKDRWLKAIHDDHLEWTHVSDLKYWANAIAKQYNINSIPANFLIDPTGKIVAKDLRGEDLDKKLDEIFNGAKVSMGTK
jgi:peroxiredoxin